MKIYILMQNSQIKGAASNSDIALRFLLNGKNRSIKETTLQSKQRANGKLIQKRGRKPGSTNNAKLETKALVVKSKKS